MCGSMADIQSAAAEIRRGKKEEKRYNKRQDENIMLCPIPQGDHKKCKSTTAETKMTKCKMTAEQKYAENDEMKQRKLKTSVKSRLQSQLVSELEFNVPFQHKYGYIRDEDSGESH